MTCSGYEQEEQAPTDALLVIEFRSPGNGRETWANIRTCATIPGVREILVVQTTEIGADLLRRAADATWPEQPERKTDGALGPDSVGYEVPFAVLLPHEPAGAALNTSPGPR